MRSFSEVGSSRAPAVSIKRKAYGAKTRTHEFFGDWPVGLSSRRGDGTQVLGTRTRKKGIFAPCAQRTWKGE